MRQLLQYPDSYLIFQYRKRWGLFSAYGELVEFFQVFTDKCQHGKEEGFLFPALMKKGIQKNDGPIGVLLDEHEKGRRYMQQLKTLIPRKSRPILIRNLKNWKWKK